MTQPTDRRNALQYPHDHRRVRGRVVTRIRVPLPGSSKRVLPHVLRPPLNGGAAFTSWSRVRHESVTSPRSRVYRGGSELFVRGGVILSCSRLNFQEQEAEDPIMRIL